MKVFPHRIHGMFRTVAVLIGLTLGHAALPQGPFWGMTSAGGASGIGTIYTLDEANVFTKKYDFYRIEGSAPKGELVKAADGLYYGVTEFGGGQGVGVLFSYDPVSTTYLVLKEFNSVASTATSAYGARPIRGLLLGTDGKIYGTCSEGGATGGGTLWVYTIATNTLEKRVDFDTTTGAAAKGSRPKGQLVQATNGLIFGTCQLGGLNGRGSIYEFNPANNAFAKRYDFAALPSVTGGGPFSGMIQASNGLLYGTAKGGGTGNGGVIFSFNPGTPYTYTVIHNFTEATGWQPMGELVQTADGLLYGAASAGGANAAGALFRFNINTSTYTLLHTMGNMDGTYPFGRLVLASNGKFYGSTSAGGTNYAGVLYSYHPATSTFAVVHNMSDSGLSAMWSGMIEDPVGRLVGLCSAGGGGSNGAMFSLNIGTGQVTELVSFNYSLGSSPHGRLIRATNGLFYGLTNTGGAVFNGIGRGILFSFDPVTDQFTRCADLSYTLGGNPLGSPVEVNGRIYALCSSGGAGDGGTIVEYDPMANTLVKRRDLSTAVGSLPEKGLFKASNGRLYGTTTVGGSNGAGTLFEFDPVSNALVILHAFNASDGTMTMADVMQASNGLLYGTSSAGGSNGLGTLWSYDLNTAVFDKLFDFNTNDGSGPAGQLLEALPGKLFGTFQADGSGDTGGIFRWNIDAGTYAQEYAFNIAPNTTEGNASRSSLVAGSNGLLYGTALQGGDLDLGLIFAFDPVTHLATTVMEMSGLATGQYPFDGLAPEAIPAAADLLLSPKVFLDGPFVSATSTMNATLRAVAGFPTTEPFTAAGFTIVGGGGETIDPTVLTMDGDDAVVDWILIEIRDGSSPATILRTKAGLLQSDGDVVEVDGVSPMNFDLPAEDYYVAVRHRNHLGVMTATAIPLTETVLTVDFTSPTTSTFGTNARRTVGAVRTLWAGNVVRDDEVRYTGTGNDRDPLLLLVGPTWPTQQVSGYYDEDVTLNGVVTYAGWYNDRDPILVTVGGNTPDNTRVEQLP